uniref:phosphoethanolamine N-methyltransferase n=1 Tax=Hanusia phi TaxID=3032 RepID=A0A7S0EM08_9CRYP
MGYYYDDGDAFNFYLAIWGGDHCHVGIYTPEEEAQNLQATAGAEKGENTESDTILLASHRALEKILELSKPAFEGKSEGLAMDMGSAYGGCARALSQEYGCKVVCVELSKRENEINLQRNIELKMQDKIIIPGELSFLDTQQEAGVFDCCVSEDSILHAGKARPAVVAEAARILRKGGLFVFSDIMQKDCVDTSTLKDVYDRIGLEDMGSPAKYIEWASQAGFQLKRYEDFSSQIAVHYGKILKMLEGPTREKLRGKVSDEYITSMMKGLRAWVAASHAGSIVWGFFVFEKL